jgi:hypothetical protein
LDAFQELGPIYVECTGDAPRDISRVVVKDIGVFSYENISHAKAIVPKVHYLFELEAKSK